MKQTDCIGYELKKPCALLTINRCLGLGCVFFKTPEQARQKKARAMKRLASLDIFKQRYIADKYYAGQMPWLNRGVK